MVESTCPACGARVGGENHQLRGDNRYIADFTGEGARPSAWPGMDVRPQNPPAVQHPEVEDLGGLVGRFRGMGIF